ncbi:MAG: GNAT family protein, partial [Chloroflexota bacterium]
TPPHARAVIGWRYEPPYDVYNLHVADVATEAAYMADPSNHYYSITQGADLIGHAVFYHEARVPGGDYRADALDVGWGLHPDMTGRGVGTEIVAQIMAFGRTQYGARRFRATVAAWNARGLKVCTNNGFSQADRFHHLHTGREFVILMTGQ